MREIIVVVLVSIATLLGQGAGAAGPKSGLTVNRTCVLDGLKYTTVSQAITGCAGAGLVVIPPTYAGTESAEDVKEAVVLDFRHPERLKGLTPVTEFGAKGDAVAGNDGESQSGSATFSSASGSFVQGRDEGRTIVITGAGPDNGSLTTTIKAVNSASRVTLSVAAGFSSRGLAYWYGTENTSSFQAAYVSRKALVLPPGKYLMTGTVKGSSPLFMMGSGAQSTIIDDTTVFDVHGTDGHFLDNFNMQSASKLTAVAPGAFPTPHPGTLVTVDRKGAGAGYQPQPGDGDIWSKLSPAQKAQRIGPTIIMSSDGIHIYRVTGDLVSILLFDVQFSEVALCDIRAGRNFVGGIALWHTPKDGAANRQDSIHDNTVRYASFSGIVWAAAEKVTIRHNLVEFSGESGLKNYSGQGDGTYDTFAEVIDNHSQHNHYDGLDMSESYPHSNSQKASSVVSGNLSSFNDRTGLFVDGQAWKIENNTFENNGLTGMSLDVSDSVISGNTLTHNNTLHSGNADQMLIGPANPSRNNVIEHNRIVGDAASGAAIKWSAASSGNQIRENTATGGAVFRFETPPTASRGNSDSHGAYPDR